MKLIVGTHAAKLAWFDKDGLDLVMTIDVSQDIKKANQRTVQSQFETAVDHTFSSESKIEDQTDMESTLDRIFQRNLDDGTFKAMTLLIITEWRLGRAPHRQALRSTRSARGLPDSSNCSTGKNTISKKDTSPSN